MQRMHTGCGCKRCRAGRDKSIRTFFHRMLRRKQKQQLKKTDDITDVNKSIGYTD